MKSQQGCCLRLFDFLDNNPWYFFTIAVGLVWAIGFGSWAFYLIEKCLNNETDDEIENTAMKLFFGICAVIVPLAPMLQLVVLDPIPKKRIFLKLNFFIFVVWWSVVATTCVIVFSIKCPDPSSRFESPVTEPTISPGMDQETLAPTARPEEKDPTSMPPEAIALGLFYDEANGVNWRINTNWKTSPDVCVWYGVECDNNGKVVGLFLKDNNMHGTISPAIGLLTDLVAFDWDSNYLTGPIPTEMCNLKNLRIFEADDNQLTGSIPSCLADIKILKEVYLQNNDFSGTMPQELCSRRNHKGGELDTLITDCDGDGNPFGNDDIVCAFPECCSDCQ